MDTRIMGPSGPVAALLVAVASIGVPAAVCAAGTGGGPNLVVIVADDLSVDLFTAVLDGGLTPNIKDRLMAGGVTFDNAFVTNSECCPSRATLLRGQYSHNHGVLSNLATDPFKSGISWAGWFPDAGQAGRNHSTIATWLKAAGYHTGFMGKYLNGYGRSAPQGVADPETYIPPGWDDWQGLIDPTTYKVYDYRLNDNGTVVTFGAELGDYQTDVLRDRAVAFIGSAAAGSSPFFLFVSPLAPHIEVLDVFKVLGSMDPRAGFDAGIRPAPRHEYLIDGDLANGEAPLPPEGPAFDEADVSDKVSCPRAAPSRGITYNREPACVAELPALRDAIDRPNVEQEFKSQGASMVALDELVGAVLDALQGAGVADNTVVIFISDNGYLYGEHRAAGKQLPYEESIRIPLVIQGPGFATGAHAAQIVLNNDIAPTLAELGGATPDYEPDGASLVAILRDPAGASWHRRSFLVERWFVPSLLKFENPGYGAVRSLYPGVDRLFVAWRTDPTQPALVTDRIFYDLLADPHQLDGLRIPAASRDTLEGFVNAMRVCVGSGCRTLEAD